MSAVKYKDGDHIDYTPVSDVTAGDVVVQGGLVAVAEVDIAANTLGALNTEGTYIFNKLVTDVVTVGLKMYWDGSEATAVVGANDFLGYAVEAAGNGDLTAKIKLARAGE